MTIFTPPIAFSRLFGFLLKNHESQQHIPGHSDLWIFAPDTSLRLTCDSFLFFSSNPLTTLFWLGQFENSKNSVRVLEKKDQNYGIHWRNAWQKLKSLFYAISCVQNLKKSSVFPSFGGNFRKRRSENLQKCPKRDTNLCFLLTNSVRVSGEERVFWIYAKFWVLGKVWIWNTSLYRECAVFRFFSQNLLEERY